ncbi:hypothetical protein D0865_05341 [Lecanosticta acicola]|uniref:C3H1-type domain-containing protein n=1 Tax=Lecanosticta acicola TaxID=111012 RepID=A0AAI8Z3Y7_9PEZI|nr:hypothetical protein D0865_05341 [Lecanosticta acicola]
MSGFQFPPPPPPPAKPLQNNPSHAGGRGRGRGERGRGRGGHDFRGRGSRGANAFFPSRGGQHGHHNYQSGSNPDAQQTSSTPAVQPSTYGSLPSLPPGSFVNPAFHPPNTFDYGTTSNHIRQNTVSANHIYHQSPQTEGSKPFGASSSPSRTVAGHKRKLDAFRGLLQDNKKPGPSTAPSVPGFGTPILVQPPSTGNKQSEKPGRKRTFNVLGLTPQNHKPQYSSDSDVNDEDADEEAMFAELGTNLTFEHDGKVMSLNTVADLASWKEERSRNFPTKDRMVAKVEKKRQVGLERQRLLMEASRALRSNEMLGSRGHQRSSSSLSTADAVDRADGDDQNTNAGVRHTAPPETELERAKRLLAEQTASLEALRERVSASEARLARASRSSPPSGQGVDGLQRDNSVAHRENYVQNDCASSGRGSRSDANPRLDMGTGVDGETLKRESGEDCSVSLASSPATSSESSSEGDSDDDAPPEEITSKAPAKRQKTKQMVCKYFVASGHCRDGDACRFKHEPRSEPTGPPNAVETTHHEPSQRRQRQSQFDFTNTPSRKGIHDLLVEQEQSQQNQLALQVIKYLGDVRFFVENTNAD